MENIWKPNVVLLGPGGAKTYLTLGAIKRLYEEENFLSSVDTWVGISAGAAISLLIVIGYEIDEIIEICMEVNLIEDFISINLNDATKKMGLLQNKTVEKTLHHHILLKFGFIPTMGQLYTLTGYKLSLVTFNLDKMRPEFLDRDTEPDLSCVEAAMMSMAIPILMQPRKYKGSLFIDGAVGSVYPVLNFDDGENKILGIYISSEEDLYSTDKNPTNYIYHLIQASMKVLRDMEIKYASSNVKHISLQTQIRDTTGLSMTTEIKQEMVNQGYIYSDSFLKINSNPEKYNVLISGDEEIPFS